MTQIAESSFLAYATLTITDMPTYDDMYTWWCTRQTDPESAVAFTDDGPRNFLDLRMYLATGAYLFYLAYDSLGNIVGAMWLHDLVCDETHMPRAGWLGTYVLPTHRGLRTTYTMWTLVRKALESRGIHSVYIASHVANARAHRVAKSHLGFHLVGVFPAFASFGGQQADCLIFSMRPEDIDAAWIFAHERAYACNVKLHHNNVCSPIPRKSSIIAYWTDAFLA